MSSQKLLRATLLLGCYCLTKAQNGLHPANIMLWKGDSGMCSSKSAREVLHSEVEGAFNSSIFPWLDGIYRQLPGNSCADTYHGHPSGYYWLNGGHGPQQVYCTLNEHCCNESDGKWMHIAFLNVSDPSAQCPDAWREVESPIRTCRR